MELQRNTDKYNESNNITKITRNASKHNNNKVQKHNNTNNVIKQHKDYPKLPAITE